LEDVVDASDVPGWGEHVLNGVVCTGDASFWVLCSCGWVTDRSETRTDALTCWERHAGRSAPRSR
jgi:hypothetical protein